MSAHGTGDVDRAPASPSPDISRTRRRNGLGLYGKAMGFWLLVVLIFVGVEVGIRHVPPDAVQVSAYFVASGRTLSTREITDTRTVADYFARLNSLPSGITLLEVQGCPLRYLPTLVNYTARFTRWGLPIMVATLDNNQCLPTWEFSSGGLPATWFPHSDPDGRMQPILQQVQG